MRVEDITGMNSSEFSRWCEQSEDEAGAMALELEAQLVSHLEEIDDIEELRSAAVVLAESMDILTSIDALAALGLIEV